MYSVNPATVGVLTVQKGHEGGAVGRWSEISCAFDLQEGLGQVGRGGCL